MIAYWILTLLFLIFEWNKFWLSFFCCFFWRMLLEYSSTFELCILAFRKRKLKKGKRSSQGESDWHYSGIIWSKNFQNKDRHADTGMEQPQLSTVNYFRKELHPRCLQGSRIPFWYISYPNILISYLIYHQKNKKIWFLLFISLSIL